MKTLNDFTAYVEAVEKLNEVKAKHAAAIAERDALLATIEGARDKTESLADQAQRMLAGTDTAGVDLGTLRGRHGKSVRQVGLWQEVVRLAQQKADIERGKASEVICEQAKPAFAELVQAELKAAHALLSAQDIRREFWQGLSDAGVSMGHLPAVAPLVRGDLRDPAAMFWQRVADAERLGYVKAGEFKPPVPATGGDNTMMRQGLRLLAAGPDGVGTVETLGDGKTTRPVPGKWRATQQAPAWGDA